MAALPSPPSPGGSLTLAALFTHCFGCAVCLLSQWCTNGNLYLEWPQETASRWDSGTGLLFSLVDIQITSLWAEVDTGRWKQEVISHLLMLPQCWYRVMEDSMLEDCGWSCHCGDRGGGQLQRLFGVRLGYVRYTQEIGEIERKGKTSENLWPHKGSMRGPHKGSIVFCCQEKQLPRTPVGGKQSYPTPRTPREKVSMASPKTIPS